MANETLDKRTLINYQLAQSTMVRKETSLRRMCSNNDTATQTRISHDSSGSKYDKMGYLCGRRKWFFTHNLWVKDLIWSVYDFEPQTEFNLLLMKCWELNGLWGDLNCFLRRNFAFFFKLHFNGNLGFAWNISWNEINVGREFLTFWNSLIDSN